LYLFSIISEVFCLEQGFSSEGVFLGVASYWLLWGVLGDYLPGVAAVRSVIGRIGVEINLIYPWWCGSV